ncbi:hypothetical protein N431DRAFT_561354 [Stipitochalara longipes BDJ]|nr:hypothetical protein N431DRAFT_561354 [Stipitochalara longipes BDJ]
MSSIRERLVEIWQPTDSFLRLVEKAAADYREQTISAKEKPVTKIKSTSNCEDVQKELRRSYQEMIGNDSSTIAVFDPQKIEGHWIPEILVLTGGTFGIPPKTLAVVTPLVKVGNPKIEYYDVSGVAEIAWNIGSVIYMAGGSRVRSNGRGNTSCIFSLFKMKA